MLKKRRRRRRLKRWRRWRRLRRKSQNTATLKDNKMWKMRNLRNALNLALRMAPKRWILNPVSTITLFDISTPWRALAALAHSRQNNDLYV